MEEGGDLDTSPYTCTGEKMTEPEIDALMAGQEDENGSVHYEGKLRLPSMPFLNLTRRHYKDFNILVCPLSAFVKHIMSV